MAFKFLISSTAASAATTATSATTTSTTSTTSTASLVLQAFLESGRLLGVHARVVVRVAAFSLATTATARLVLLLLGHLLDLYLGESLRFGHTLLQHHDLIVLGLVERHLLADEVLDALEELDIVLCDERDGASGAAGARRSTHAVNVVLGVSGYVEVDDHVDVGNVEAAAGHVGGDENGARLGLELVERAEPLGLGHLAVERYGGEAEIAQQKRDALRVGARRAEDDERVAGELVEHVRQVDVFVLAGQEYVALLELLDRLILARHLDLDRVAQRGALQLLHLLGHGGRVEVGDALLGYHLEHLVDFFLEVHVEDAVGLVHDQVADGLEREALGVLEVVDEAAGRGDHDVRLLGERYRLRHHVHAAHDGGALDANARAQRLELLADLVGQLARRRQHEREQALRVVQQRLQDGQRERARLARAGLGQADDVLALEGDRQRLALNGRRPRPLELLTCLAQFGDKTLPFLVLHSVSLNPCDIQCK